MQFLGAGILVLIGFLSAFLVPSAQGLYSKPVIISRRNNLSRLEVSIRQHVFICILGVIVVVVYSKWVSGATLTVGSGGTFATILDAVNVSQVIYYSSLMSLLFLFLLLLIGAIISGRGCDLL